MRRAVLPVAYRLPGVSGLVQILRTGSGFWRGDHGFFSIDEALLRQILANTQTVGRPIRVDFMHWANAGRASGLEHLAKAAEPVDPRDLVCLPWVEPETGAEGWGIFAPINWTWEARHAISEGVDQISPVIDWAHHLSASVPGVEAGTFLGATILGISLVDEGFFQMDPVRLYQKGTTVPGSEPLYQEHEEMKLTPAQLKALLQALEDGGIDEETQTAILDAISAGAAQEPVAPEYPEDQPADPSQVMPARRPAVPVPGAKQPARPAPAQTAASRPAPRPAAPAPVSVPARSPLSALVASLQAQAQRPAAPAPVPSPAAPAPEAYSRLEARLEEVSAQLNEQAELGRFLLVATLRGEGRLAGIEDPEQLLREAPAYFAKLVNGTPPVVGAAPAGRGGSALAAARADAKSGDDDEEKFAKEVLAYQEAQAKAGRVIQYRVALSEVEANRKQRTTQARR